MLDYGRASGVQDADIVSRQLVYTGRPIPSYRIDYTSVSSQTGAARRGAVLITFGGVNAVCVFVASNAEDWSQLAPMADDIFLRVTVGP